jgi:hypothetical protein
VFTFVCVLSGGGQYVLQAVEELPLFKRAALVHLVAFLRKMEGGVRCAVLFVDVVWPCSSHTLSCVAVMFVC